MQFAALENTLAEMGRFAVVTVALALLSEACSSTYQPARSPRIAVIQEGGTMTLVRDGQSYSIGLFGGGLEDAVEGNPVAEEHASTFKTLTIAGWSLYLAGLGSSIGGVYLLSTAHNDSGNEAAGAALSLGGLAAVVAGGVLFANAQPRIWDAVNTYNDGVDAAFAYPMPPPGFARPPAPPSGPNAAPRAPTAAPPAGSFPPQR